MAKRTKKPKQSSGPPEFTPVVLETFRDVGVWEQSNLRLEVPTCFNGRVAVRKYRITVERIEEPLEVIHARLIKLWRECDNCHHISPLAFEAKQYGLDLHAGGDFGCDRPKRK